MNDRRLPGSECVASLRRAIRLSSFLRRTCARAALVGTQFVGVAMMRYISRIEPLASLSPEDAAGAELSVLNRATDRCRRLQRP
jgi:hypothetical protein